VSAHPIEFRFDAKKAAQAANKLLRLSDGQRNYMELVKLLYLADREALLRFDLPITGDFFVALAHGPALSRILDLIRWGPMEEADAPWFVAVSPLSGYNLKALPGCGEDELSDAEDQVITEVFQKYGKLSWQELFRLTHDLPEWGAPAADRMPISPEQILLLEGKSKDDIERIRSEVSAYGRLDHESDHYRNASVWPTGPFKLDATQQFGPLNSDFQISHQLYLAMTTSAVSSRRGWVDSGAAI
jgi:uncharacterized phage-associated protein